MTLIKTQVKTYRIDKVCPYCKEGLLIANGTSFHYNFYSTHVHNCNKCGKQVYLQNERYPHEITEDIGKPKRIEEPDNTLIEEQNVVNEINYNNLCAKATLGEVPEITLNDLKGSSNSIFISNPSGNNTITQQGTNITLTTENKHLRRNPNTI